jgi:hypothetical protein
MPPFGVVQGCHGCVVSVQHAQSVADALHALGCTAALSDGSELRLGLLRRVHLAVPVCCSNHGVRTSLIARQHRAIPSRLSKTSNCLSLSSSLPIFHISIATPC